MSEELFTRYDLYQDMLEQPHLLIAGATGSGKSVVISGLIYTALLRNSQSAQFVLIDPKRVELSMYRGLPHVLRYASEPGEMLDAIRYCMDLCEQRYREMQRQGVRKYTGGDVWLVIDEFADLMTTQARAVKPLIQRLAQIGRAAKVHIILATQTPISKVLPTEIKCNFDARVGLRTRSAQDSRNILGYSGLELLPRYGECVYMKPEGDTRYKVPYLDDQELLRMVNSWKSEIRRKPFRLFRR